MGSYKQLSLSERIKIQIGIEQNQTLTTISAGIGRSTATVSRQLSRNKVRAQRTPKAKAVGRPKAYRAETSNQRAKDQQSKPRIIRILSVDGTGDLWRRIKSLFKQRLSPEQISATLKQMSEPVRISHETIYQAIYAMPKGELRKEIVALLRLSHKTRRPRAAGEDRRGAILGMVNIKDRPEEIEERLIPGHWEGDLIKGKGNKSQVLPNMGYSSFYGYEVRRTIRAQMDRY